MKYWIDNESGDNFECFETEGHTSSNLSSHLDALKIASAWGYSAENGYFLHTEDGFLLEVVDPYHSEEWGAQIAFDYGSILERAA